ncbi:hypothetical protein CL629_02755 [bacterium]|nr:hypothetical protein [bacterium]|tara:strand:- start:564 stop:1325 length:762 start_codon:yes stop_codon:yes gene_type:complete
MEGEERVLHRGELAECLHHYREVLESHAPRGSREIVKLREPMARFCGVGDQTVTVWLREPGGNKIGSVYFKLICFMRVVGYEVTDLIRVRNTPLREITEIIGYSILSDKEVTKGVGYAKSSTLFKVLRGENQPTPDREKLMRQFCRANREKVRAKKEVTVKRYEKAIELAHALPEVKVPATTARSRAKHTKSCEAAHPIVLIMSGVSCFLEQDKDRLTDTVLATLSEEDAGVILDLSSKMSALSSRVLNARKK